jgi:cytoskeleton protein RodZ
MSSIGETLRRERVRKDLSIEQISRETKISARLLDAIENEQFDRLPGGVFAKSFVKQYAHTLGLDEEELAAEVQKLIQPQSDLPVFAPMQPQPEFKVPKLSQWEGGGSHSSSSALPSLALLVAVMLVCSGIYALWQRSRRPASVPPVPAAQTNTATPAPKQAASAPITPAVANSPETPPKTDVSQSLPAEPAASRADTTNASGTLHISMTADEPTWVRAWADEKEVFTATLEPNVVKTVDASGEIRIRTGNAGGLQITFNGKPVGPIGPKGQIRVVQVTPSGVQILVPPKPAPVPVLEDPL